MALVSTQLLCYITLTEDMIYFDKI